MPLAVNEKIRVIESVMDHESYLEIVRNKSRLVSNSQLKVKSITSLREDSLIDETVERAFIDLKEVRWGEAIESKFLMLDSEKFDFPMVIKLSEVILLESNAIVGFILIQYSGKGERLLFFEGSFDDRKRGNVTIKRCEVLLNATYQNNGE